MLDILTNQFYEARVSSIRRMYALENPDNVGDTGPASMDLRRVTSLTKGTLLLHFFLAAISD